MHMFEFVLIYAPIWIPALILLALGFIYLVPDFFKNAFGGLFVDVGAILLVFSPFWLFIFLAVTFWFVWNLYVRVNYAHKLQWVLLEIRLPRDVFKSPLAMETFLMHLRQTGGETTFIDRNFKGKMRPYFSLEIVSIEGNVKFYIYTEKRFQRFIEAGLYAHYPGIEIHESVDYTKSVHYDPKELDLYVIDYEKDEPDPYPIKTYVEYGIDDGQAKEETKVDPINSVLELMGSIGANQQLWLQFIIKAHKKEQHKPGTLFGKTDKWKDDAKAEIKKIRESSLQKTEGETAIKFPNPTKGEQERIAALERSISKISFDVGIRSIYLGKKDFFNGTNISGQRTLLRAFSAPHLNALKPTNWLDGYDYPWQDWNGLRQQSEKRKGLEAYKRRSFFYKPFIGHPIVCNVEELATMFHLPGQVAQTPSLNRIPSKKSEAPANLPI